MGLEEHAGVANGIASFAEHEAEQVPDVRHVGPDFEPHRNVGGAGASGEARGVIEQDFSRTHVNEQR